MLRSALPYLLFAVCTLAAGPAAAQVPPWLPELAPRTIAARAASATVGIRTLGKHGRVLGSATGFFVSESGLLATNYHTIDDADALEVVLPDGKKLSHVWLVAIDPHRDLALLRVAAPGTRPLPLGSDQEAAIGDPVYVMGNPLGMNGTFSDGMVSAKRRIGDRAMLQITAPISPGSSGGPVLNAAGEVIGVVALSVSRGQNLNLAVTVADLRALISADGVALPFARSLVPPLSGPAGLPVVDAPAAAAKPAGREGNR